MEITVRETLLSDFEAVERILAEAKLSGSWFTREALEKGLNRNDRFYLVAETGGEVVGTIFATHDGWYCGYIYKLATLASHRRMGIARKLIVEVTERFKQIGIDWYFCSIKIDNEASVGVFNSAGFEVGDKYCFVHKVSS